MKSGGLDETFHLPGSWIVDDDYYLYSYLHLRDNWPENEWKLTVETVQTCNCMVWKFNLKTNRNKENNQTNLIQAEVVLQIQSKQRNNQLGTSSCGLNNAFPSCFRTDHAFPFEQSKKKYNSQASHNYTISTSAWKQHTERHIEYI